MGIGKTINALGEYDFYSSDYKIFLLEISNRFKCNLKVSFDPSLAEFDSKDFKDKEQEFYEFGFENTYLLVVNSFDYDYKNPIPVNTYIGYDLTIPIEWDRKDELFLEFLPNHIFCLKFIPYSNYWCFFVENIISGNSVEIKNIRTKYVELLKKIGCSEVMLWTHAYHKWEVEITEEHVPGRIYCLEEVMQIATTKDNIRYYDFMQAIEQKITIESSSSEYHDVGFYDKF